jgi:hypothetical protein
LCCAIWWQEGLRGIAGEVVGFAGEKMGGGGGGKGMNEWMMIEDMLWLVLWIDE